MTKPAPVSDEVLREVQADLPDAHYHTRSGALSVHRIAAELLAARRMIRDLVEREINLHHDDPESPYACDWALVNAARSLLPTAGVKP